MNLSPAQRRILMAMREGATLKAHRTLDGEKTHRLHPLEGEPEPVDAADVEVLREAGLIASNMKFPAATYVLTAQGIEIASTG
jgi:hypothetical protein